MLLTIYRAGVGSRFWLLAMLLVVSASSGCASVSLDPFHLFGNPDEKALDPEKMVVVELRAENSDPKLVRLAHDDSMVVQTALQKSGATKRFSRMKVSLVRPRPDGKGPHKLEVKYEQAKHHVALSHDYALRPGDRIVAIEDTTTAIDDAVDSLTSPLKIFSRKR